MNRNDDIDIPILLSAFNRPDHLKKCLDALRKNPEAEKSTLFISCDGPRNQIDVAAVEKVRDIARNISGFRRVFTYFAEENTQGAIRRSARNDVLGFGDCYITLEDDCILSPSALKYFHDGLRLYEDRLDIHAVCGHIPFDFRNPRNQPFLMNFFSSWAVGLWCSKHEDAYFESILNCQKYFKNFHTFQKINSVAPALLEMMYLIVNDRLVAGDVHRNAFVIINDLKCVYPCENLVNNIGFDGSGEHCLKDSNSSGWKISNVQTMFEPNSLSDLQSDACKSIFRYFGGEYRYLINNFLFFSAHGGAFGPIFWNIFRVFKRLPEIFFKN